MHALSRLSAAVLSCGLALAAGNAAAKEPPPAGDCFVAGFKAADADAVAACYAEDALIWFPGGSMAKGRQAIRDGFAHFFADVTVRDFVLSPIGMETVGETKMTWGTYTVTVVDKTTQAEQGSFSGRPPRHSGRRKCRWNSGTQMVSSGLNMWMRPMKSRHGWAGLPYGVRHIVQQRNAGASAG